MNRVINHISIAFSCLFLTAAVAFAQDLEGARTANVNAQYRKEIERLAKNKQIQTAFQSIVSQNKRNRDELIMLTEIAAPPFKEEKRAARFVTMLKDRQSRERYCLTKRKK
jgi:tripeptide aminopeptidase